MKKHGKKNKKHGDSEFFANNPGLLAEGLEGWQTSAAAMDMDVDGGASKRAKAKAQKQQQQAAGEGGAGGVGQQGEGSADAMDTSEFGVKAGRKAGPAASRVPGLQCEVKQSMKRGNRTTAQKKRKTKAAAKAVARAERLPIKTSAQLTKKQSRAQLKGLY